LVEIESTTNQQDEVYGPINISQKEKHDYSGWGLSFGWSE
jgi:hypothetical protein